MKVNAHSIQSISKFEHLNTFNISDNKDDGQIKLFRFPINARKFDYNAIRNQILESVCEYALDRSFRESYKNNPMTLSSMARKKFKDYTKNNGELGELLLFCFLEGDLKAPKILSKMQLKTSNNMYVHGSDGIHLHKIDNGKYHLIFGESKSYRKLSEGIKNAIESIKMFVDETNKSGEYKSGINFEKGLISSNLEKDIFEEGEEKILEALIYPTKTLESNINIEDAFSIFLCYELESLKELQELTNDEFKNEINKKIIEECRKNKDKLYNNIKNKELLGHTFYVYILPFTDLDLNRKNILEAIVE